MYESLPPPYRQWVADQAAAMGLPGPDDFLLLLVRMDKQRQDLEAVARQSQERGPGATGGGSPDDRP